MPLTSPRKPARARGHFGAMFAAACSFLAGSLALRLREARGAADSSAAPGWDSPPSTASEARFGAVLEAAPDAMITVGPDGRIELVNSETERLFAYHRSELIGRSIELLLPDRFRAGHAAHRRDYAAHPRRRPMGMGLDLVARRKDGSEFPTEISLSPLEDEKGLSVIVAVRDITERRRAEEQRAALAREQAARVEAELANRAKDEFLAVVSHELRTPLNAILGWAVLLQSRGADAETTARALQAIERNARMQRQMIEDLLDVSAITAGKVSVETEEVDLRAVVEAAEDSVRLSAKAKGIAIEEEIEEGLPRIPGDVRRLQQVFWNLLTNAVKFTPEGGRVRIRASADGSALKVVVEDTGIGIAPAFLPHVFDRFRQLESSPARGYGGLGLGLAIVRELVELHGGTVVAESEGEGRGTRFTVALPVQEAHPKDRQTLPAARPGSPPDGGDAPAAGQPGRYD